MYHCIEIFGAQRGALNLTLNLDKCEFGKIQIKFLGHIISVDGVSTDPEKIQAITEFPNPKKAKDIRAFLRLTGYFCRFTPEYSKAIDRFWNY